MNNSKGDFSKGSVLNNMFKLSMPIILAELVQVTYNLVDRMYIGHIPGCGTEALTGIGLVLPFITFITAFSNLCSYGGATLSAVSRGEKDDEKAEKYMENAFTLLVVCGLVLTFLFLPFTKTLVMWLGGDEVSTFYACEYFDIYLIGNVFTLISLGMNSFINMQGYSVIGMCTVLIGALLNIALDPIFMFTMGLGIKGAAIATVISQFASALWVFIFLCRKNIPLRLRRLRLNGSMVKDIVKLGVGGFMFRATDSITIGIINSTLRLFGGPMGTIYIASMSIINSFKTVIMHCISGFVEGTKPVLSYNYGAKEYGRVDETMKYLHFVMFGFTTLAWAALMFLPDILIRIFTNDIQLIETCIPCVKVYFCVFFFMTLQSSGQNTFVALKHPGYTVIFSLWRKVFLIVPLTLILPRIGLGVMGVFWAEAISEVIGGLSCHITMYFAVWKDIKKNAKQKKELCKEM